MDNVNLLGTNSSGQFQGYIPPEMSAPIFEEATKRSAAMQLVPQTPLGPLGKQIPIFTGRPTAEWVAEAGRKPISTGSVGLQSFRPEKIAGIFVVSEELVRVNPAGFIENMRNKMAESFAVAFDAAFFHGEGSGSSDSPFSQNLDQTSKVVELGTASQAEGGVYRDFVSGLELLLADGKKRLRSFALDEGIEPMILSATDLNGRPLFVAPEYTAGAAPLTQGTLLRRPATVVEDLDMGTGTLGYGGDFSQAVWGVTSGITWSSTNQTSLPLGEDGEMISLWQHNLVAVRAEAEYGFLINDTEAFVRFVAPSDDDNGDGDVEANVSATV